jgi:hypothetical protein
MNEIYRKDLENRIRDFIKTQYGAIFNGLLEVIKEDSIYTLKLGIPSYMYPTVLICEASNDEDFLKYIYNELATRNYIRFEYYRTIRTPNKK